MIKKSLVYSWRGYSVGNSVEDFAKVAVPREHRRSWIELTFVTSGFTMAVSGMFAGASVIAGLGLINTILVTMLGNLILFIIAGLMGGIGAETGYSTILLTRKAFGKMGSMIIGLVFAITLVGWFSVQAGFFGQTINSMFPEVGFITNVSVASAWGGALMILTAYFGYKGIRILSNIAIPLLLILSLVGIIVALNSIDNFNQLSASSAASLPLTGAIVIIIGTFAAGAVIQPDISRYAKSKKQSWLSIFLAMVVSNSFIIIAGAITAASFGTGDLPAAMLALGLGIPALLILVAAQWTSNDSNLYSASLALSNILGFKKSNMVLVVGIIATILGAAGVANYFTTFLTVLGTAIPPIAGVLISDYYLVKKQNYYFDAETDNDNWVSISAWFIGALIGFSLPVGIASINSLLVAFIVHYGISTISTKKVKSQNLENS